MATEFRIERLDPRLDALFPQDVAPEPIASGLAWAEGPVWDRRSGRLLFSDVKANRIWEWRPGARPTVFEERSGYPFDDYPGPEPGSNGLAFDAVGRLTACEHGNRRVARREPGGAITVLADRFDGKRLHSPNDLVYTRGGALYFTDPPYGLPGRFEDPARELPFYGVYRWTEAGGLTLAIADLPAPNGICFSPDEALLYVTTSGRDRPGWFRYEVAADGGVGAGALFFDAQPLRDQTYGGPDGVKCDRAGNVFGAGLDRVTIIAPDGAVLGFLFFGALTGNLCFGEEGNTLFVCAEHTVWRIPTTTCGATF